jgi:putative addiction module component (TIGR02574 family)
MTRMSASLAQQALQLPPPERLHLIEQLWDSLAAEGSTPELTDTQRSELDARLEDLARNPDVGRPWSEVRADLEARRR